MPTNIKKNCITELIPVKKYKTSVPTKVIIDKLNANFLIKEFLGK